MMKLLIAYDGSPCADAALEDLLRAGLPETTEAIVLSVADVILPPNAERVEVNYPAWMVATIGKAHALATQAVADAQQLAERACARVRAMFPTWTVRAEACADSPAWAIVKKAAEWQADLIVVGSHGYSALGHMLLGSVSQTVLTASHCSVHIARRVVDDHSPVRLVVGVDGSADSARAVHMVTSRQWPTGSAVRVTAAIDPMLSTAVGSLHVQVMQWIQPNDDEQEWVRRMAESYAGELRAAGLIASACVKVGNPKQVLVAEADQWGADCIFVGARGLNGLERLLLGSVSTAIATRAHCSVEVVRTRKAHGAGMAQAR